MAQLYAALRQADEEAAVHQPKPPSHGLVMEIGSGQSPQSRVDVVVEKYLFDDFERPKEAAVSFSKPVVVGDGEALPFADGAFAYCMCLHVLEHATDPALFAGEIARVAQAGFVQVPSRLAELTFGWPYHPWLIDKVDGHLVFEPKNGRAAPCGDVLHDLFARDALTRTWFGSHRSLFHHSAEWSSRLSVEVTDEAERLESAHVDVEKTVATLTQLAAEGAIPSVPVAVRNLLRCPRCRAHLNDDGGGYLFCETCACRYPFVGGVPVLLLEAAS